MCGADSQQGRDNIKVDRVYPCFPRASPELMERKEMGDLCARITFETVRECVEKRRTSPDCCNVEEVVGGAEAGWLASEVKEQVKGMQGRNIR